jgi:hypothetical protein
MLLYDYFQRYSNIKRLIYYNLKDFFVTQGIITATLTLPDSEVKSSVCIKGKQQDLLQQL